MFERKLNGYVFKAPSQHRKFKKYDVYDSNDKYITSFGDIRYEQFHDKIGHYKDKDHNDPTRRDNYRSRHKHDILDKNRPTAGYFSWTYLW
jgi:hypothetical protein